MFDLLYREYSDRLAPLAARAGGRSRYLSENIIEKVLADLLAEDEHAQVILGRQILLRNLLPDMGGLTPAQAAYVQHRASVDVVLNHWVTKDPHLVIEVDRFALHENDARQRARDRRKDAILAQRGLPLLRLPATGSGEQDKIRAALRHAGDVAARRQDRVIDLRQEVDLTSQEETSGGSGRPSEADRSA